MIICIRKRIVCLTNIQQKVDFNHLNFELSFQIEDR